ncbi:hypothetical protein IOD16_23130 [Saccharothrix sp. 6-C]|uniref:hypothetical protein n=1 Tax=Saccharothrix sp. 6-C TaxID=2781735 RepID=UPI001917108A|nr:hypothetical protein [Saccharothrix sp. 6-C]QQQ74110.1 hypothetical protein IOD16_23130 [Saccharothrix sp. 6-C]
MKIALRAAAKVGEAKAVTDVLGGAMPPVSWTKGDTGHLLVAPARIVRPGPFGSGGHHLGPILGRADA